MNFDNEKRERYYGLRKGSCRKFVIFRIEDEDLDSFLKNECSRKDTTNPIYKLVEVTDKVFPKQNEKVFTCLTARPQKDKQIPFYYIKTINTSR